MAAGLHALDHQRIDVRAHQLLRERERGSEADQLGAARLDPVDRPARRKTAGEHDVADAVLRADIDQLAKLRVHGDEVDAERPVGARLGLGDLGVEQLGLIAPQAITPKPPALEMAETRLRSLIPSSSRRP